MNHFIILVMQTDLNKIIFENCKSFMFFVYECKIIEESYWNTKNATSQAWYSFFFKLKQEWS